MKIKYLGTGAAEGVPAVFCHCDVCEHARRVRGRNIRSRCQVMIDDYLMLDFGPDTYWHSIQYGLDLSAIRHCLISHAHGDHVYPHDIKVRRKGYANLRDGTPALTIYGGKGVLDFLQPYSRDKITEDGRVVFHELRPYEAIDVGGYGVTALPAAHGTESPLVFVIERDGKAYLYGHDSDMFCDEAMDFIKRKRIQFDCASLDCTNGVRPMGSGFAGHLNFERLKEMRQRLSEIAAIDSSTTIIANHFTHNGLISYDDFARLAEGEGITVAYDGMEIEI